MKLSVENDFLAAMINYKQRIDRYYILPSYVRSRSLYLLSDASGSERARSVRALNKSRCALPTHLSTPDTDMGIEHFTV